MTKTTGEKIPKNWEELVELKEFLTYCNGYCSREDEDENYYEIYLNTIPKKTRFEILDKQIGEKEVNIVKNAYPYTKILKYLPGVKHYCLWSRKGELSKKEIEKLINKKFGDKELMWFERKSECKSIPEIWHCHIMVKN